MSAVPLVLVVGSIQVNVTDPLLAEELELELEDEAFELEDEVLELGIEDAVVELEGS